MRVAAPGARMVVVDAEPITRAGVARLLEPAGWRVVGEATTGHDALGLVRARHPHVVVTDTRLPDLAADAFCRQVLDANDGIAIVIFATDQFVTALAAGARAVVSKRSAGEVLVDAMHAVAVGKRFVDPDLATAAWLSAPPASRKAVSPVGLTTQELKVLALLPRGLTNEEIAGELGVGRDTAKTHVANIQRKLRVRSRTEAAVAALHLGLG